MQHATIWNDKIMSDEHLFIRLFYGYFLSFLTVFSRVITCTIRIFFYTKMNPVHIKFHFFSLRSLKSIPYHKKIL